MSNKRWQGDPQCYYHNSHYKKDSFWHHLALDLHELLDIPLSKTRRPKAGYAIIRAFRYAMTQALRRGEPITINGFGQFYIKKWTPAAGRRIVSSKPFVLTPEFVPSKPRKAVVFKPSNILRNMLKDYDANRAQDRVSNTGGL